MISKRLIPVLAALILFSFTTYFMGPLTQSLLDSFWLRPGVAETIGLLPQVQITQSSTVQHQAMLSRDILPLFGSSELRSGGGFAPGVVFAGKPTGFTTFYVGGAVFQRLPHAINLTGQDDLNNRKLVILLPSDWFFSGLAAPPFAKNFSSLQVYQMLFSPSLPAPLRQAIIKRILQYPQVLNKYHILDSFLKSYENTGWKASITHLALWPIARLDFASMQLQDAIMTIQNMKKLNPKMVARNSLTSAGERPLPWNQFRVQATKQGKSAITNQYGVDNRRLANFVDAQRKDSQSKARIDKSPEYYDLELLLKVLKAKGAMPLFVILPYNGPYRDFTGFPAGERQLHYQRLRQLVSQYGFPFADLSSRAYVPYYFNDSVHLSGRGWVDIDEILDNFYHNKQVL
ncbi:MAG TPA: D-alanyl-lipoteichoic acid biosynthesis protein DltD [Spirochaetia bacterium]|nr:D-alanyl-lipoteichoic acid biosynthesis protein DltD [Spirochaetia bacterium]